MKVLIIYYRSSFFFQIEPLVYHENSKIDIEYMKNFYSEYYPITEYSPLRVRDIAMYMDDVKILQDVFAMQMPPERYDGLINLLFIFKNANATTTEITIALVMCAKLIRSIKSKRCI